MLINAYDFDGTIYPGDSSVDFYLYCRSRTARQAGRGSAHCRCCLR